MCTVENSMFNVLLVAPNFIEKWNKLELACKENLSINALAAYLLGRGYNVVTINAQFENWDNERVLEEVKDVEFDFIGVSCSPQKLYLSSKDFIKKARKRYPTSCITIGGVFPSLSYEDILNDLPEVDFVSTGEGELALELICHYLQCKIDNLMQIPGLAYRSNGKININPSKRIENLDSLPFPIRDVRTFSNVKGVYANVIAGRGCYGNCSFCSIHSAYEYRQRICRSPKNVVDEIEDLIQKYGVEFIQFHDDIFYDYTPKSQQWLKEFIQEVKERSLDFRFRIYLRPNDVRKKELLELKEIGLDTVFIGIESGVQRILNEMRKGITVAQAEEAMKILREVDIEVCMGFITIVPTMTFEELKKNYAFLYRIGSDNDANFHNRLNIYNGCYYENNLRDYNLLIKKTNFWDIHTYHFLDIRVEKYHDYLQFIKMYGKKFKHMANNIVVSYGQKYSKLVNQVVVSVWTEVTIELLEFVETVDVKDTVSENKIEFIEDIFDKNIIKLIELEKQIALECG